MLWVLRTGVPRRDLPERYGSWRTVSSRFRRRQQAEEGLAKAGVRLEATLWTLSRHDTIAVPEAPDDETATAAMLTLAAQGQLRTETLRTFTAEEMQGDRRPDRLSPAGAPPAGVDHTNGGHHGHVRR